MKIVEGDIFDSGTDAIVIPVNCVPDVMGKGLAYAAKQRIPGIAAMHTQICSMPEPHRLHPGDIHGSTFVLTPGQPRRMVWLAATKDHWRNPSRIEWVDEICRRLADHYGGGVNDYYVRKGVPMLAVPALGCGEGGLDWAEVLPIMERHFAGMDVRVYLPREGK